MITRRQFTKTLGGAAALSTFSPVIGWAIDEPKVSADAAKLYRDSFILDGNALASIGNLLGAPNPADVTNVGVANASPAISPRVAISSLFIVVILLVDQSPSPASSFAISGQSAGHPGAGAPWHRS